MLTESRQKRLDEAVAALKKIAGVGGVNGDDWDSAGINVFIWLEGDKFRLNESLRKIKFQIAQVCKPYGFRFLDQPVMKYEWVPAFGTEKGYQRRIGYDKLSIMIDLYIA